ncbi:MAG: TIGR03086 family metal-binding protein [Candidatus Saccharimonadia bacterium]
MQSHEAFLQANQLFSQLVQSITPDAWIKPTPCDKWNVRQLVAHVAYENAWVPDLLNGKTVQEIGNKYDGELLGDDPKAAWKRYSEAAEQAVHNSKSGQDLVHLSFGDFSVDFYINQLFFDHIIHSWDLAVALSSQLKFNDQLVEYAYNSVKDRAESLESSGLFKSPVAVEPNAPTLARLVALSGRDPNWNSTS